MSPVIDATNRISRNALNKIVKYTYSSLLYMLKKPAPPDLTFLVLQSLLVCPVQSTV